MEPKLVSKRTAKRYIDLEEARKEEQKLWDHVAEENGDKWTVIYRKQFRVAKGAVQPIFSIVDENGELGDINYYAVTTTDKNGERVVIIEPDSLME